MQSEDASALLLVDKSWLFLPQPTNPQNPYERYLQCPATGYVYCLSTGSLYRSSSQKNHQPNHQPNKLTTNILSLNQIKDSRSFHQNPTPCTIKKFVSTKSTEQPVDGNDASTTPNNGSKKSLNMKKADLSIQVDRAPINHSTKAINADQHIKGNGTSTAQTNSSKTSKDKQADQTILGRSVTSPKKSSNTCSNVETSLNPNTKKEKKRSRRVKDKSFHAQDSMYGSSKKHSQQQLKKKSKKQNKHAVFQQHKSTILQISKCPTIKHPTRTIRITPRALPSLSNPAIRNQSKTYHAGYNPFLNFKNKSFRFQIINLQPMSNLTGPFEINLDHLVFPQKTSPRMIFKDVSQRSCSSFDSGDEYFLELPEKPSLYFSREDQAMFGLLSRVRKKTATKKSQMKVSFSSNNIWNIGKSFNRRPDHHYNRRQPLLDQYKKCIMASSVHEIIHSRFAKNTDERMPVSQVVAILSSGERKLRKRQKWMQQMEEEAIQKYKNVNCEQNLVVEEYDVLHHPRKSWLVSYGRWVINKKCDENWPLMVKCLYKHPDCTLRQASKHRSFCLRWNGTSYTLRMDHAYYTQMQCHMAVTNSLYSELIVHTRKETAILTVYFDLNFWKQTEETLETFFNSNILPYIERVPSESSLTSDEE